LRFAIGAADDGLAQLADVDALWLRPAHEVNRAPSLNATQESHFSGLAVAALRSSRLASAAEVVCRAARPQNRYACARLPAAMARRCVTVLASDFRETLGRYL
jgi:hypothetical protein